MTSHILIVDLIALLLVALGVNLAFRQDRVRHWWARLRGQPPRAPRPRAPGEDQPPSHYAMLIFGVMLAAFGLIIFGFVTMYGYFTAPPAH